MTYSWLMTHILGMWLLKNFSDVERGSIYILFTSFKYLVGQKVLSFLFFVFPVTAYENSSEVFGQPNIL